MVSPENSAIFGIGIEPSSSMLLAAFLSPLASPSRRPSRRPFFSPSASPFFRLSSRTFSVSLFNALYIISSNFPLMLSIPSISFYRVDPRRIIPASSPAQNRTCAINAYGSSSQRSAPYLNLY